jgi:hypothetical protein
VSVWQKLSDHGDHIFGKPTTGMAILYALKDICHAVTLYGFGTHDNNGNPTTYKYYRQNTTDRQSIQNGLVGNAVSGTVGSHAHSFLFEQEVLHALDHVSLSPVPYPTPHCSHAQLRLGLRRDEGGGCTGQSSAAVLVRTWR